MLKQVEAKILLRKSLESEKTLYSEDKADDFLEMLTYLPLAMSPAAAYMKKNRTPMERYMTLFQETPESAMEILEENFHDPNRARESRNAVAATWFISFQRIEQDDKLAADYLTFSACIAPQNVPRDIFPPAPSAIQQEKAIGTLTGYAFLTERTEKGFYDIHPLVHHVTRGYLEQSGILTQTARGAIKRLRKLIPFDEDKRDKQRKEYPAYLPHGLFTADIKEIEGEHTTINLLDSIGRCYMYLGEYNNAVLTHRKAVKRQERAVGLQNEGTLRSRNNLGLALASQGHYDEAEELLKQGVSLKEKLFGSSHLSTLISMGNLASIYRIQGRYQEAEALEIQVLEIRKTKLGGNHPDTLTAASNLAQTWKSQGRHPEAISLMNNCLRLRQLVLGSNHPDTEKTLAKVRDWNSETPV